MSEAGPLWDGMPLPLKLHVVFRSVEGCFVLHSLPLAASCCTGAPAACSFAWW